MDEHQQELDVCGLGCPLPVLHAKKKLSKMDTGEVLRVIATDPGTVEDFKVLAKQTGNALLDSREEEGKYYYLMRKG